MHLFKNRYSGLPQTEAYQQNVKAYETPVSQAYYILTVIIQSRTWTYIDLKHKYTYIYIKMLL